MNPPELPADPPAPARRAPFSARFGFIFLGRMLGAALAAFVLAFQLADQDPQFVSVAKLTAAESSSDRSDESGRHWDAFHDNIAFGLLGGELKREALKRVQQRHPGLRLCEVAVEPAPVSHSPMIKVIARGDEPRCVQFYLEALLSVYLDAQGDLINETGGAAKVLLLEPASPAIREEESRIIPLLGAAHAGAVLGGLAGFLLSLCLVKPRTFSAGRGIADGPAGAAFSPGAEAFGPMPPESQKARQRAVMSGIFSMLAAGTLLGLLVQVVRMGGTRQTFRSLAKVVDVDASDPTPQTDHHRWVIGVLESPEARRATLERMRARHPEKRDREVEISVRQTRGTAIFNVIATGPEPGYTRLFLGTLLDEFMTVRDRVGNVVVQERATAAAERVEDWEMPLLIGAGAGGGLGAVLGCLGLLLRRREPPPIEPHAIE